MNCEPLAGRWSRERRIGELHGEVPPGPRPSERVLPAVLFVDRVGSTELVIGAGDGAGRQLLERYYFLVWCQVRQWAGYALDAAGDGFFAVFRTPVEAIGCAWSVGAVAERLGVRVRAGVHAGECEVADGAARGDAVHIGARIAAFADPGEVLVSPIAKDLVVGSGLRFEPRGTCTLQGVPGIWPLFAPARNALVPPSRAASAPARHEPMAVATQGGRARLYQEA